LALIAASLCALWPRAWSYKRLKNSLAQSFLTARATVAMHEDRRRATGTVFSRLPSRPLADVPVVGLGQRTLGASQALRRKAGFWSAGAAAQQTRNRLKHRFKVLRRPSALAKYSQSVLEAHVVKVLRVWRRNFSSSLGVYHF